MPSSLLAMAPAIIQMIYETKAKRILDVGPGRGKYGLLIREYIGDPERLDAVEAWPGYITPRLRAIYDTVYEMDVCEMADWELDRYDLVLMVDVIEHIDKPKALALLARIRCPIVVCTPEEFFQNPEDLPPTERHRSHWTLADFYDRIELNCSQLAGILVRLR